MSLLLFVFFPGMLGNAWAQGPKPTSLAELARYIGADRERILYDGAKREGKIVWYTSLVPHKEIAKLFEAKYPGVVVETYRADGTDLSNRLLAETQAKRYIADAVETTPGPLMPLRDNQVLLAYSSPYLAGYPDIAKEKASAGLVY
jgi:iron(III) transport system substrate-binding protein